MKKISLILFVLVSFGLIAKAHHYPVVNGYGNSFVFDEDGITFSVYPDGEFDFFIEPLINSVCVNTASGGFSFNSGYDYSPYLQYDDYGAVIQVENVPVYYDYYGRVSQIGDVAVNYRNRRVCQVGGLFVQYNHYGYYVGHTGFINMWNPYYTHRPHYSYFARPLINLCLVNLYAYRAHYRPIRHVYYRPYAPRARPHYATIGHTYSPSGRGVSFHYRQSANRNETAFHRGDKKVAKEVVRNTTTSRNMNSTQSVNRGSNSIANRPSTKQPSANRIKPNRRTSTSTAANRLGRKAPNSIRNNSNNISVNRGTSNRPKPVQVNSRPTSRNTQSNSINRNTGTRNGATVKPKSRNLSSQSKPNRVTSNSARGESGTVPSANRSSSNKRTSLAKASSGQAKSESIRGTGSSSRNSRSRTLK